MNIAIIGAGVSGASILRTLLNHQNFTTNDSIDIFEPREELGSGLPYDSSDDQTIMLNVTPDKMSIDSSNPYDFSEWLEKKYTHPKNHEGLVSRPQYGKYLLERFKPYVNHKQVQHIQEKVEDLEVLSGNSHYHYKIKTPMGWQEKKYDAVFLSIGHPPYNDFYHLIGEENYIHHPYPFNETLNTLDTHKKIGIIGSGATAIDLMRYFDTYYDLKHPLTYYDIREPFNFVKIPYEKGEVAFSFSEIWIDAEQEKHGGFIPFDKMLSLFRKDMAKENIDAQAVYETYKVNSLEVKRAAYEKNDQKLAAIQEYINRLIVFLPELYNYLTAEDRDYYLNHYHEQLNFFKSLVPNKTYKWLFELVDAGKLNGVSNTKDIIPKDDGSFMIVKNDDQKETADILINASGFETNLARLSEQSTLIKNLYKRKIILPHIDGNFVLVDWPMLHVMNQRYGVMKNLFFTGLLIGSTQHENNDAPLTIRQAIYTAKYFMDQLS